MRWFKFIAVVGIVMFVFIGCGPSNNTPSDFNADEWVSAWVEIWNTYDLNQVDNLFLTNDHLTYFSSEKEGVITGIDAVREHHRGFGFVEGGKDQPNKLWLEDIATSAFGDAVVVTAIWYFQRPDGSKQRGPVTIVYVQQGDEYRIAHMNFSNYRGESKL